MLRKVKDLRGYAIRATDGGIGTVDDFYFDDDDWGIRYLVVDAGNWLLGRRVLISPMAVGHAGWMAWRLPVNLTRAQVEGSSRIDTQKPVSRQHDAEYLAYCGYPYHWGGAGMWGMGAYPGSQTVQARIDEELKARQSQATPNDCHLRSTNAITGYHIEATDGELGHVEDFLVDDRTWAIRYLIVDTSNWIGGRRVLVSPRSVTNLRWSDAKVSVDLTRQALRDAPRYEAAAPLESGSEDASSSYRVDGPTYQRRRRRVQRHRATLKRQYGQPAWRHPRAETRSG